MTDLASHQEWSNWVLTGRRVYHTNPDWDWDGEELEEVITVDGVKTECDHCGKQKPVLKLTCDTPNMLRCPWSVCFDCTMDFIKKEDVGFAIISDEKNNPKDANFPFYLVGEKGRHQEVVIAVNGNKTQVDEAWDKLFDCSSKIIQVWNTKRHQLQAQLLGLVLSSKLRRM